MSERIDAHQHYWRLSRGDYGWLTPALAPIYRNFAPADLAPHLEAFGIARTVLVQAAPTEAETEFLLEIAAATPSVAGVVGWIDMEAEDAPGLVMRLAENRKLVGLRPMIHDIADPRWMLSPRLGPAFTAIIGADLVFDALVRPWHLSPSSPWSSATQTSLSSSTMVPSRTSRAGLREIAISPTGRKGCGASAAILKSFARPQGWSPRRGPTGSRTISPPISMSSWRASGRPGFSSVATGPWSIWPAAMHAGSMR